MSKGIHVSFHSPPSVEAFIPNNKLRYQTNNSIAIDSISAQKPQSNSLRCRKENVTISNQRLPRLIETSTHCPLGASVPPELAADPNTMLTSMPIPTPTSRTPTPLPKSPIQTSRLSLTTDAQLTHRRSRRQLVVVPRIVPAVAIAAVPPIIAEIAMPPSQSQVLHPRSRTILRPLLPTSPNANLHVIRMELMQMIF